MFIFASLKHYSPFKTITNMKELIEAICKNFDAFKVDATKDGNKAAAQRARKVSLEIEKQLKQYRKDSVK